jgi:hypothetical protein
MNLDSLLDRLLALAPLGVLVYAIRRAETERREYLRQLAEDREHFRNERRELINRVQFPTRIPVATAPTRPADRRPNGLTTAEDSRAEWAKVGTVALPQFDLPSDADDAPGGDD